LLISYFSGSLLNNYQQIKPELMRRIMFDIQIEDIKSSGVEIKELKLLENQP